VRKLFDWMWKQELIDKGSTSVLDRQWRAAMMVHIPEGRKESSVTPEMIQAGLTFLRDYTELVGGDGTFDNVNGFVVREIYEAMERAPYEQRSRA